MHLQELEIQKIFLIFLKENHLNVVKEINFPDHYKFILKKILKILNKLEKKYNAKLITTEKDYLRINHFLSKKFDFIK